MCCLRYEDKTYDDLRKNLPRRKSRVGTPHGPGEVRDTQILTQLVLVSLDHNREQVAVPVEELVSVEEAEQLLAAGKAPASDPLRGMSPERAASRSESRSDGSDPQKTHRERSQSEESSSTTERPKRRRSRRASGDEQAGPDQGAPDGKTKSRRSRRRRKPRGRKSGEGYDAPDLRDKSARGDGDAPKASGDGTEKPSGSNRSSSKRPKRRRRRPRGGSGDTGDDGSASGSNE